MIWELKFVMSEEPFTIDHLAFCNGWNGSIGKPFVAWSEAAALAAHNQGKLYCVLFFTQREMPLAAAEIRGGAGDRFIDVKFLGKDGELEFAYYYSSEFNNERLFLRSAMCFGGARTTKDLTSHSWRLRHVFEPNGIATTYFFQDRRGTKNTSWRFNAACQWIEFPTFGNFDRLAMKNFGQEWSPEDHHGLGA